MLITHFFTIDILVLFFGSFVMCGWYLATRGELTTEVDGSIKKEGAIFKEWYFFWFAEDEALTKLNWIQYKDKALVSILDAFVYASGIQDIKIKLPLKTGFTAPAAFNDTQREKLEDRHNVKITWNHSQNQFEVFKNEPIYKYPWWIRTPMAGCITCFPSVYGTLIFTVFHFIAWQIEVDGMEYNMLAWMYGWSAYALLAMVVNYLALILMWSYLNTLLNKLLGK